VSGAPEGNLPASASPTTQWLTVSPLPALTGVEAVAERLVLLAHYGVDFTVWGGSRRGRYWDALAERVRAATYAGPDLHRWWADLGGQLPSAPRDAAERLELAQLLSGGQDRAVLQVLRDQAPVLVMRVRVVSETRKAAREQADQEQAGEGRA
jgi:hypothetical protein